QQQKSKKASKVLELKQIRMGLKIGPHDLSIKLNHAQKFLEIGHKVKITLVFRGREQAHKEIGFELAQRILQELGDSVIVDQEPQLAGRQLSMVVRHSGKKTTKQQVEGEDNAKTQDS
ncbi:MAG TPA: translation initiation factor IF-3, partial [Candidatus Sulfotelmatobacter sp.]|nr:translation initiation factor IF-3 [Candidatus Sulfotelmatobacter sp.]